MFWRNVHHWRGVALIFTAVVATLWLAFTSKLVFYIHPRYIIFTVIMAAIGIAFIVGSVVIRSHHTTHHGEDDEGDAGRRRDRRTGGRVLAGIAPGVSGIVAVAMLVVPPATLTSATASQRDVNSTALSGTTSASARGAREKAESGSTASFTVADWSSLLRQSSDLDFYRNKAVDVVGFVIPDPDDPGDVFYVSRFVVTCCAVDAQPTGIPVYMPNWADELKIDSWVRATGEFDPNPSRTSEQALALAPTAVENVGQPDEPYLY